MKEKKFTPEQMVYFARYVIEQDTKVSSLQNLLCELNSWQKDRPNEQYEALYHTKQKMEIY